MIVIAISVTITSLIGLTTSRVVIITVDVVASGMVILPTIIANVIIIIIIANVGRPPLSLLRFLKGTMGFRQGISKSLLIPC